MIRKELSKSESERKVLEEKIESLEFKAVGSEQVSRRNNIVFLFEILPNNRFLPLHCEKGLF